MTIATIGETKWFPVFRAGVHTAADGKSRTYDDALLDKIVEMNAPRLSDIPFTVGHPALDKPKYGTLAGIKKEVVDGVAHLFVKGRDVVAEFADQVAARMFDQVSISHWPDMKLKHIGFLGAEPPAVAGLPQVDFAAQAGDATEIVICYSCAQERGVLREIVSALSRIRDYVIGRDGVEAGTQLMNADTIKWLYSDIEQLAADNAAASFSSTKEGGPMDPNLKALQDEVTALTAQVASFSAAAAENTALKTQVTKLTESLSEANGKLSAQEMATRTAQFSAFTDGLIQAGQLLPANRDTVVGLLGSISALQPVQFSSQAGAEPVSPAEALKGLLASYPKQIEFSRAATGAPAATDTTDPNAIASLAIAYQKDMADKGIVVSVAQAVAEVVKPK